MSQLIRNVIKSNPLHRIKPTQTLPSIFHQTPLNHFSTEPENPNPLQQQDPQNPQQQDSQQPPPPPHSFVDSVFHHESKGAVYGKLLGLGKHTLKTDIINMLEGCGLTPKDIKLDYTRYFSPIAMVLQFPSGSAFTTAARVIRGKGRILTLERLDPVYWKEAANFDGKTVLLQGLPRFSTPEDVERFLCGCNFNASNMELFLRGGNPDPIKMALVHFPSQAEAMRAVLSKNKNFVLNNQVMMRVLQ